MASVRRRTLQAPRSSNADVHDFLCSVCHDIYKSPHRLPCSHVFCRECLQLSSHAGHTCPYCRQHYNSLIVKPATDIQHKINTDSANCKYCNDKIPLRHMQHHLDSCDEKDLTLNLGKVFSSMEFKDKIRGKDVVASPVTMVTEKSRPVQGKLRAVKATFDCPCCSVKRLDRQSLLEHVTVQHRESKPQVVCPICASMPWGDPKYKSASFIDHIKIRHKFDYDYFVDMNKDEEEVLKEVLTRSVNDH